jgi:hypothetical protein
VREQSEIRSADVVVEGDEGSKLIPGGCAHGGTRSRSDGSSGISVTESSTFVQPATSSTSLASRLLDDNFHAQNHLLCKLPHTHLGYKAFAHAFSEALLVPDAQDEEAVKAVLAKKNIPWKMAQ